MGFSIGVLQVTFFLSHFVRVLGFAVCSGSVIHFHFEGLHHSSIVSILLVMNMQVVASVSR